MVIRFLLHGETKLLRRLRMAALAECPQAFGERTEEAAQRSDVEWDALAEKLAAQLTMAMVLAEREAEPIGMTFALMRDLGGGPTM